MRGFREPRGLKDYQKLIGLGFRDLVCKHVQGRRPGTTQSMLKNAGMPEVIPQPGCHAKVNPSGRQQS